MKFLQKNLWQLISVVLAIVAIFATYNVFFLQRTEKGLEIIVSQPVSLVDVNPEAETDIQVLYKDNPVSSLYLFQIQAKNSGNEPIIESDFTRDVTFSFSDKYEIADVSITASEPPNIGALVEKTSETEAKLFPALLNPEDIVSIRFILLGNDNVDASENILSVDGRIVGIKEIKITSSEKQSQPEWVTLAIGVLLAAVVNIFTEKALEPTYVFVKRFMSRKFKNDDEGKAT